MTVDRTAEPRWSHVALNCADQTVTEAFYSRWFGFTRVRAVPLPDAEIVFLRSGPVLLELFGGAVAGATTAEPDGPHGCGVIRHLAFQVDDVDALLSRMGDAATVTSGPIGFDDVIPGWRTAWIRDPDGVIVEVSQGYRDQVPADDPHGSDHTHQNDHAREPA